MSRLRKLDERLWILDAPAEARGLALGARATIIGLSDGGVAVISPVALDAETKNEVEALGPVRALIAPNSFHHLFLESWRAVFPHVKVYVSPVLAAKKPGLHRDGLLSDEPPPLWAADMKQALVNGAPKLGEYVFFHPASRTVIQTDSAFNVRNAPKRMTRIFMQLNGGYGAYGPTRYFAFLAKDKHAVGGSFRRMLEWDFDRIVVAHGAIVEVGGRAEMRRAYTKYLAAR
jgi:hypothetical protein